VAASCSAGRSPLPPHRRPASSSSQGVGRIVGTSGTSPSAPIRQRHEWRLQPQEEYKLFIAPGIRLSGPREVESLKDPNHVDIVRAGSRKDPRPRNARQQQPAKTLGNPISAVRRNDKDPAKLEFIISGLDTCANFLEDVITIPSAGRFDAGDRRERVTRRVMERKPLRITNAAR
jgi:hypothetical protein